MIETLTGVLIGGLLTALVAFIASYFQFKQWKKGIKIEHLHNKRLSLIKMFQKIWTAIQEGKKARDFDTDAYMESLYLCPKNVTKAIDYYVKSGELSEDSLMYHEVSISAAMKKAIKEIDEQIENELK